MATTDINGMVFYTTSDLVTPLASNINAISTAVTNAFNSETRTFRVANQAARDALLTSRGASLSAPLQVDRADTGVIERNTTGVIGGWVSLVPITAPAPYTPVLAASGTPASGYTSTGRYIQVGKLVTYWYQINMQSVSSVAGGYTISLPVAAVSSGVTTGAVRYFDSSSGNAILGARPAIATSTTLGLQVTTTYGGALGSVAFNFPWSWATGDIIDGFIVYEAA